MAQDKSIFSLRLGSNTEVYPTQDELRDFLESPVKAGSRELRGGVLATYTEALDKLTVFESRHGVPRLTQASRELQDKILYGVLGHSRIISPALKSAVEHYLYLVHALAGLDFNKPSAFIRTAREEMARLNPRKKDDAAKLARLSGMTEERKRTLETLAQKRAMLVGELTAIALYIRDNLLRIAILCETSICVLVELHVTKREEKRLIEDLEAEVLERAAGGRTGREESSAVAGALSALIKDDVFAMTGLYEAIHDHARKFGLELDAAAAELTAKKNRSFEQEIEVVSRAGKILVSLLSDCRFELPKTAPRGAEGYAELLHEKRGQMLARLFEHLKKERRVRRDRRVVEDRRKFQDPNYRQAERRSGKDRRSGKSRRTRGVPS